MSKNKKKKSKNKVNKNTQKNVRKNQFDINKFIKDNNDSNKYYYTCSGVICNWIFIFIHISRYY